MTQFSAYIFRQTLWPTLFFLVVLTGVVWLSQGLRMLDMVVNRGQTAGTFLELAIFVLPSLLTIVLPISLFCATLYTLNRLYTDSEVVVMWSAGLSRWSIATPILVLSLILTLIGYVLSLYLMPLGYRAMKDKVYEIRADIATGLFREGAFTYPSKGLAVFVREVTQDGELRGIFIQDTRSSKDAGTYMAESGRLVRTARGPMLIMRNGTLIRSQKQAGDNPIFVEFAEHQYLPEEFASTRRPLREYNERYLPELLHPNMKIPWERQNRGRLISEGHMRLATPLYNIALPMIAVALLLCGAFNRRGFGMRIIAAVSIAILIRIAGVGAHGIVQKHLSLAFLHYLIPLATVGICALFLGGFTPGALIERIRRPSPQAAAGAE
jgi:lipopolysaccharide export system permease protein